MPEHSEKMLTLTVSDLTYSYEPTKKVINRLSFSVKAPAVVHLVGDNGSGKTTTLLLLAGFYVPQQGTIAIWVERQKIYSHNENYYKHVYYVGSRIAEDDHLSLTDYIRFVGAMRGAHLSTKEILQDISMEDIRNRRISQLSAGMRRRFLIRLAMALNPYLLLLDEPFSVMDREWSEWLSICLKEYTMNGRIVVMAHPDAVEIPDVENVVINMNARI